MMLFPVLLSNLQRLSTAFEKKKNTQSAVFISILSDFNRARDVAKRPGDVCSATTEAERRPRTFEPRRGSKTRKRISIRISFSCSFESARRDSNPRPRPWQGRAPPTEPLAHRLLCRSCLPDTFDIIQHELQFVNTKFEIFMQIFRQHTIKR